MDSHKVVLLVVHDDFYNFVQKIQRRYQKYVGLDYFKNSYNFHINVHGIINTHRLYTVFVKSR